MYFSYYLAPQKRIQNHEKNPPQDQAQGKYNETGQDLFNTNGKIDRQVHQKPYSFLTSLKIQYEKKQTNNDESSLIIDTFFMIRSFNLQIRIITDVRNSGDNFFFDSAFV